MKDELIERLIEERRWHRSHGDAVAAERIQTVLREQGIVLTDLQSGTRWHRADNETRHMMPISREAIVHAIRDLERPLRRPRLRHHPDLQEAVGKSLGSTGWVGLDSGDFATIMPIVDGSLQPGEWVLENAGESKTTSDLPSDSKTPKTVRWKDLGVSGYRKYNSGEMHTKRCRVEGGWIYRFEDEIDESSGKGGTVPIVRPSYVFVPDPPAPRYVPVPSYPRPPYPPPYPRMGPGRIR